MEYIFKGKLCGYLCNDCSEPLGGVKVRLYHTAQKQETTLMAVADPNKTFHQLNKEELAARSQLLLAETTADASGVFSFTLNDQNGYKGEAFDVDFVCGTGFGKPRPPKKIEELQFHITTLQPQWREKESERGVISFFGWEYCIVSKWWCLIMKLIDRWVICGRVVDCESRRPVAGVKVFAYDVDLLQDDPLGSSFTDASGHFRIIYTTADFSKTIFHWLNVEWPAGPDLYFRVESSSGSVLLKEPRHTGHRRDRTNAHNCFCVELCIQDGDIITQERPWFTHIGNYKITSDISPSGFTVNNRSFASGTDFGFFGAIKLVGYATKKVPTDTTRVLFYRFRYSLDGTNWHSITQTQIYPHRLKVGTREITWNGRDDLQDVVIDFSQPASTPDSIPVDNAPAEIPDHVIHPDANGWVRVDQPALGNGFYGPLLWVDTRTIVPGGNATDAGDLPGVNPAVPKLGKKVYFVFQTTDDPANPASPHFREQAIHAVVYINNWDTVSLLKLDELSVGGSAGCNPITTSAQVRYTADHDLIAEWTLDVFSNAIPESGGGIKVLTAGSTGNAPRGHHDVINFATAGTVTPVFSTWPSCAYRLSLVTRRKLTDGEHNDSGWDNYLIFCR